VYRWSNTQWWIGARTIVSYIIILWSYGYAMDDERGSKYPLSITHEWVIIIIILTVHQLCATLPSVQHHRNCQRDHRRTRFFFFKLFYSHTPYGKQCNRRLHRWLWWWWRRKGLYGRRHRHRPPSFLFRSDRRRSCSVAVVVAAAAAAAVATTARPSAFTSDAIPTRRQSYVPRSHAHTATFLPFTHWTHHLHHLSHHTYPNPYRHTIHIVPSPFLFFFFFFFCVEASTTNIISLSTLLYNT